MMQMTGKVTRDSLMTLEAYSKWRKDNKPSVVRHRKLRSVQLGEHLNAQFESELTIRYQIQEMLRIEKIFEEEGIEHEEQQRQQIGPRGRECRPRRGEQAEAGQHGEQERNDEPPGDRGRRRRHAFFVFAAGREPEREAGAGEGDVDEPGDQPGQPPAEDGRPTGCDSGGEEGQTDGDADEQGKVQQPI